MTFFHYSKDLFLIPHCMQHTRFTPYNLASVMGFRRGREGRKGRERWEMERGNFGKDGEKG